MYENILLSALALVLGFALLAFVTPRVPVTVQAGALPLPGRAGQALSFACLFAVWGIYCAWGWSGGRRTLPMKTWRIALRTTSGAPVSLPRAAARYCACWTGPALAIASYAIWRRTGQGGWSLAFLAFNYAWAWLNADRQFLQDRIAGTRIVGR